MSIPSHQDKVAIVYDWLDTKNGGAERVLVELLKLYPEADLFAAWGAAEVIDRLHIDKDRVHFTFLQRFPTFLKRRKMLMLGLLPSAFYQLDLGDYSLVISVTSAFAKCLRLTAKTRHVCYLLTPPRYLWEYQTYLKIWQNLLLFPVKKLLQFIDKKSAHFPNKLIAISKLVSARTKKYYQKDSEVIYPPFDYDYWRELAINAQKMSESYYLVVGRLVPYKSFDLVIEAFNELDIKLLVIGKGAEKSKLQKMAGSKIRFLEEVNDRDLASYYKNARGLIMPQVEEFGYTSLEAQACGCPVLTYTGSGTAETILEGKTGLIFPRQSVAAIVQTVRKCDIIYSELRVSTEAEAPQWLESFSVALFANHWQQSTQKSL